MENVVEILLVDKDVQIRDLLEDTLQTIGYKVRTAEDLLLAETELYQHPVDMIIFSNELVNMDNYAAIKNIRSQFKNIPIILISEPLYELNLTEAQDAGVDGFLKRPFRIEVIERIIEETLTLYDFKQIGLHAFLNEKVLVVDDDHRLRTMLIEALRNYGYRTFGAMDGTEALSILSKEEFDIVITDIRMPAMDGISLMKEIKRHYPSVPVVIITGYSHAYTRQKAFEAGADGFLSKPFRLKKVEEILRNYLGGIKIS